MGSGAEAGTGDDPLVSWNDGAARDAILAFVTASSAEGSAGFIDPADRVAAFDNDGTLWVEQPMPAQAPFLLGKLVAMVQNDPGLGEVEPYRSIVSRDEAFFTGLARQDPEVVTGFLDGVGRAWAGVSPEDYEAEVRAFVAGYRHERFGKLCTELVYQPMLELFDLLRGHGWRIFVCSGGGRDFMRVIAEETWGLLRENVIGSAPEWVYRDGALVRESVLHGELALGPGKPSHIYARTGRLPRFAAGNGDVDIEMLDVAHLAVVIVHDDAEREYATTSGAERVLKVAEERGWTKVSMQHDWKSVFIEGAAR